MASSQRTTALHRIASLLTTRCTCFVHEHFDHDEQNWRMFISEYEVQRYCYIGDLQSEAFF